MEKYIIVELIPTRSKDGDIIQLSALKIHDINLVDRFDYRLVEDKILLKDLRDLISYDKENFKYKDTTKEIIEDFKDFIENYELIIIDNAYTTEYLKEISNNKKFIHEILDLKNNDFIIEDIIKKFELEPSNYIVDLMYEAIIKK